MGITSTAPERTPYAFGTITLSDLHRILPLPEPLAPSSPNPIAHTSTKSTADPSPTTIASPISLSNSPSESKHSSVAPPSVDTNITLGEEWPQDTNVDSPDYYSFDSSDSSYQPSEREASFDVVDILTDSDIILNLGLMLLYPMLFLISPLFLQHRPF